MKPLTSEDILPLDRFLEVRPAHQQEVLGAKAVRRLMVGAHFCFLFENRVTARWQIHEMCRVENIRKPEGVAHELRTYNDLIPRGDELSTTLLIAYEPEAYRDEMLEKLSGLHDLVSLQVEGCEPAPAIFEKTQFDGDRVSSVQFVRFPLTAEQKSGLLDFSRAAAIVVEHPVYPHRGELAGAVRGAVIEDLLAD